MNLHRPVQLRAGPAECGQQFVYVAVREPTVRPRQVDVSIYSPDRVQINDHMAGDHRSAVGLIG